MNIKRAYLILVLVLFLSIFTGCSSKDTIKDEEGLKTEQEQENSEKLEKQGEIKETANTIGEETQELTSINNINYKDLFNLKECVIQYDFSVEEQESGVLSGAKGDYDLNKDGEKDKIELRLGFEQESVLEINDSKISFWNEVPSKVYLIDLIKDDDFIELAIYDWGPSADPVTTFYRYDGKNIQAIGSFDIDIESKDTVGIYYGNVLTNGKGIFIRPSDIIKFIQPPIIKGFDTIKDDKFFNQPIDYRIEEDKFYEIRQDFETFFVEGETFTYGQGVQHQFKKGEKIKILGQEDISYKVELEDGTKGILYFWIGD